METALMLHGENLVETCSFPFILFSDLIEARAAFTIGVDECGDLGGDVLILTRLESLVLTAGALPRPRIHRHVWLGRILVVVFSLFANCCNHQK